MRTVVHFPSEAAALVDVCTVSMALEKAGWRRLHFESDTLIQDTWQHDEHAHDIVCRWTRNLCDRDRELFDAVIAVAAYPPVKRNPRRYSCQVPWSRIGRLRAALDAAGVEWRPDE